jgi:xanthine/CO dehydrogenase XdhC/CoxF family maturation factor
VSPSEIAVSIMAEITAELRLPKEGEKQTAKVQAA